MARRPLLGERLHLADPGTRGHLQLRVDHARAGVIEHEGDYVYVGMVHGLHAFAPAGEEPVVYLHRTEVLAFEPETGGGR